MNKKNLILIPGQTDWCWQYLPLIPLWRIFGYNLVIMPFGWQGPHASFEYALLALERNLEDIRGTISIVGIGMSGLVAINILIRNPHKARCVVAIAPPRYMMERPAMNMRYSAMYSTQANLALATPALRERILLVNGLAGRSASTWVRAFVNVTSQRVRAVAYFDVVLVALTVQSRVIREFFER